MTLKRLFALIFWIVFLAIVGYVGGWVGIVESLLAVVFYGMIFYFFHFTWMKIRSEEPKNILEYYELFAYRLGLLLTIFLSSLALFSVYQNEVAPARLPLITITNGEKTIKFQTMAHIANPDFYSQVRKNVEQAKKDGYVLYFEGVRPGSKENMDLFNKALGIDFSRDLYDDISKLYGLVAQKNEMFLGLVNDKDVNVDISVDDIVTLYKEKLDAKGAKASSVEPANIRELMSALTNMNEKELKILVYINQAMMNYFMKNDALQEAIISSMEKEDIMQTILGDRNKVIADTILTREDKKVYMLYGMLHFNGVHELLREKDPRFQVIGVEYYYPIKGAR